MYLCLLDSKRFNELSVTENSVMIRFNGTATKPK
jgi:hypothetical protein